MAITKSSKKTNQKTGEVVDTPTVEKELPKDIVLAEDTGIVSLTTAMSSKDLKAAVKVMTEQRTIIKQFVNDNLVKDVDYGQIEGTSKSGNKFLGKPTLYKPGMEKILSLFGLATELERDVETLEMLTDIRNAIAFKCSITRNGQKIAEGRGAAVVGDMSRDLNATIKIAEKRARMDACLSLGFSEYFTQDMDDPDYRKSVTATVTPAPPKPQGVTDAQRKTMFALMNQAGINDPDAMKATLKANGYPDSTKVMSRDQASEMIHKLHNGTFTKVVLVSNTEPPDKPDVIYEDIEQPVTLDDTVIDVENPEPPQKPKVFSEEAKADVTNKIESLGLKPNSKLRLLKETTGHVALASCTDLEWEKLRNRIEAILENKETLPEDWFIGEEITKKTPKQKKLNVAGESDGTGDSKND